MKRVSYKPNHVSFGAFMLSEQMRDVTARVARDIATLAEISQPPPSPDTDPEEAHATYSVEAFSGSLTVNRNPRVRVVIKGENAERAEFGTRSKRRYRTLAKAGAKFGDFRHSNSIESSTS